MAIPAATVDGHEGERRTRRLNILALSLLAACAGWLVTVSVLRVTTSGRLPIVNVRWTANTTDDQRVEAEKTLSLVLFRIQEPGTRSYFLLDTTSTNLERLVRHPLVEDTAHINRGTFALDAPSYEWTWVGDQWTSLRSTTLLWLSLVGGLAGSGLLLRARLRPWFNKTSVLLDLLPQFSSRTLVLVDGGLACIVLALVFREALRGTGSLVVPPDPDLFRDAAQASAIAQGAWGADGFFAGERLWYNPLVPSLAAMVSKLVGAPVLVTYARAGAVLNLLGPAAFFVLVALILGSGAAAAATFCFLLMPSATFPPWATGTYSPWLYSGVFSQALFYAGLIAVHYARRSFHVGLWFLCGIALGVTFLGHAAPAILLGGILLVTAVRAGTDRTGAGALRASAAAGVCFVTAFLVSMPLTASILFHYGLKTVNPDPAAFVYELTAPSAWKSLVASLLGVQGGVLAIVGLMWLVMDREARRSARILWAWMLVNGLVLALHYGSPLIARLGYQFDAIVPAFHFVFYTAAIIAVLQGYAIWRLALAVAEMHPRARPNSERLSAAHVVLAVMLLCGSLALLPRARWRVESVQAAARTYENRDGWLGAGAWIRSATQPGDVFLSTDPIALFVIGPNGGRVVAVDSEFANPYVRVSDRQRDRDAMFTAIRDGNGDRFCDLAARYQVRYVMAPPAELGVDGDARLLSSFPLRHSEGGISAWQVTGCRETERGTLAGTSRF